MLAEQIVSDNGNRPPQLTIVDKESSQVVPAACEVSIVVPTRNESGNIDPLLRRVGQVMQGRRFEVIFVDDSTDNTVSIIKEAAASYPFDVAVIARPPERRNGLGKAVVEGINAAHADWVVVMDGDLQHPPEAIPQLLQRAQTANADIVVASRLSEGGSANGLTWYRKLISYSLALASRIVFPGNLRRVTDPLTGFFLVNRKLINREQLNPPGFKILLEILCRNPQLKVAEIPFQFAERHTGTSKANGREMLRLFEQVLKLRFGQVMARFLVVGASGILVNTALMYLFTDVLNMHYLASAILATQGSTLWNFAWTERWVYPNRSTRSGLLQRMGGYYIMNNGLLLARGPFLALMVTTLGVNYLVSNLLTLIVMTAVRFLVADSLIWRRGNEGNHTMGQGKVYYYNIHNILRVRSMQRLPELVYFRTSDPIDAPDLDVRIVANPEAHQRQDSLKYREVLGRHGFSVVINRAEDSTQIYVSPLVGKSPHVLYTNVVEPLLRWRFVLKGYALMHGACLSFNGSALFITAQTDTGKTTTILYTVRSNLANAHFLSDDMTIFSRDGSVLSYPKPLTISKHTLQAVGVSPLAWKERWFLQIQSRLHSRGGRKVGMALANGMFPAATLNTIVQAIIPPPKYMVDHLVPGTQLDERAHLAHIVLIERGEQDLETEIDDLEKVRILVANAEDAYGFPPYPVLAHELSHWQGKSLHKVEEEIVTEAIQGLPGTYLRSANFGWYKRLPSLVEKIPGQAVKDSIEVLFPQNVPGLASDAGASV